MSKPSRSWLAGAEFDGLRGSWRFERSFSNQARMRGVARFEPQDGQGGDSLRYSESGLLTLPAGTTHQAQRSYLYTRLPDGFSVWFDEQPPRLFHEIRLGGQEGVLVGGATHLCGADRYDTRYDFHPDGSFAIRHVVVGPRKDYTSVTVFYPAA